MSHTAGDVFDDPFAEQREMRELLSQETRHLIVQCLLGHPHHLASLAELSYMIQKNEGAILDQLETLQEAGLLDVYVHEPNISTRDLPSRFWGPTERGVEVLYEHNFLRGVPVARAVYEETNKSEKVRRHETAPRPSLPEAVQKAFQFEEPAPEKR
ncbi:ArsR family transcriptional regulator [Natrarchaeobius chitinivorans]|uniref:ArsR family transcriptional regulator n=1 Tax=Natrarchaeobius chitinivorans TaxID=1679083 RepID=A0A3N6LUM9_NATCH|nr:ArsR family transcriptional regulator [Natrarchaeobius chitinivorans]RQG93983.1 ArsR family transcriptional regulator [Natrarchaeobius chitinivorans]